jgi:hypothetical protein
MKEMGEEKQGRLGLPADGPPTVSSLLLSHEDLQRLRGLQSDSETRTETWLRNDVSAARPNPRTPEALHRSTSLQKIEGQAVVPWCSPRVRRQRLRCIRLRL